MLSVLRVGVKKQALHISFFIQLTLTLTLTLFFAVCQSVTAKSEGVRVKKEKKFFLEIDELARRFELAFPPAAEPCF